MTGEASEFEVTLDEIESKLPNAYVLGKGQFAGAVKKVYHEKSDTWFAVKVY